jgi:hypothetical protein
MVFFDRHNAAPFSTAGRFIFEALSLDSRFGRMQPEGIPPASNQEFYSRHHSVCRMIRSTPVDVAHRCWKLSHYQSGSVPFHLTAPNTTRAVTSPAREDPGRAFRYGLTWKGRWTCRISPKHRLRPHRSQLKLYKMSAFLFRCGLHSPYHWPYSIRIRHIQSRKHSETAPVVGRLELILHS